MPKGLKRWLLISFIILFLDTEVFGMFSLTAITALYAAIELAVTGVGALRTRQLDRFTYALKQAGVSCVAIVVALSSVAYNSYHARIQAALIVDACQAFEKDKGHLPGALTELVPGYLPAVPRAWISLSPFSDFRFYRIPARPGASEHHTLEWTIYPPFYRGFYYFEERRWSSLD